MEAKNKKIIESYFQALAQGDIPKVFSLLSSDTVWNQPGKNRFSGSYVGIDNIGKLLGSMMEDTAGSLKVVQNGDLMVNKNLVIATVEFSAQKGSKNIKMSGVDLFTIQKGKIKEINLFSGNQKEEDVFWGN